MLLRGIWVAAMMGYMNRIKATTEKAKQLVPPQEEGKSAVLSGERQMNSEAEALVIFNYARDRLLNPACWDDLAAELGTSFMQTDRDGNIVERPITMGDYIRIDIPGPGPVAGHGYDWVTVMRVEQQKSNSRHEEFTGVQLMVSSDPHETGDDAAHFFEKGATSTFLINRKDRLVTATYYGRNEVINNATERVSDNIRNTMVGAGAILGLSEIQWKSLLDGFLGDLK